VTFDSQEGTSDVTSKTVYYDFTYGTLPTPTRENYAFEGWYTAKEGGSIVTSSTIVTRTVNHTLYAHWAGKIVTVTYDKNGGDGANFTRSVEYGKTYGKVDNPSRTGWNFLGWYDDPTYYHQVTENTNVNRTDDHTLYAKWEEIKSQVSFDSQGGSSVSPKIVTYGYKYGDLETPKKPGYTFDGWFTKAIGGSKVYEDTPITIISDQTLYAHWTRVDPETCPHTDYTEQIISPRSCFTNGLKVCTCNLCDKHWEVVIRATGKHEYDVNKDSKLNAPCIHCGETKYIGDMSLEELSLNWERSEGHNYSFNSRGPIGQKEILIKWIYAIKEREDPKGTTTEGVKEFVEKIYKDDEGKAVYDVIGDLLYDGVDYGQTVSGITDLVGQLKDIGKVGECDLSKYSKVCGKVFLFLALTNPDTPWDVKAAKVVGEFLPITGPILEGVCEAGHVAVFVARSGVAKSIGAPAMFEAVEDITGEGAEESYEWLMAHEEEIKKSLKKQKLPDDVTVDKVFEYAIEDAVERELNQYIKVNGQE